VTYRMLRSPLLCEIRRMPPDEHANPKIARRRGAKRGIQNRIALFVMVISSPVRPISWLNVRAALQTPSNVNQLFWFFRTLMHQRDSAYFTTVDDAFSTRREAPSKQRLRTPKIKLVME